MRRESSEPCYHVGIRDGLVQLAEGGGVELNNVLHQSTLTSACACSFTFTAALRLRPAGLLASFTSFTSFTTFASLRRPVSALVSRPRFLAAGTAAAELLPGAECQTLRGRFQFQRQLNLRFNKTCTAPLLCILTKPLIIILLRWGEKRERELGSIG